MKQRQLPFGYAVENGQVVTLQKEADAVRWIFEAYLQGGSYQTISDALSQRNLPYHAGKAEWNKHMVKRMLEQERYLGTERYPSIIDKDTFERMALLREGKNTGATEPEDVRLIRRACICGQCGQPIKRHTKGSKERWYCQAESCQHSTAVTDDSITAEVIALLNLAIGQANNIRIPEPCAAAPDLELMRLNNEINRELDKPDCNEDYAKALIMARAAIQYEQQRNGRSSCG